MHAFRTLRSPCHQRPQRPPCPIGHRVLNRRWVSKRHRRVPQRHRCVSKRPPRHPPPGVTNGRRITHHRVSLTVSASPNAAVSLITGMSLTAAALPTAAKGCRAIGIVTYKMQFDTEICAIYTLQTSQTRLAVPRDEVRQARGHELMRATRRANCSRVLNEVSESGIGFTRLALNSSHLASSRLVAISGYRYINCINVHIFPYFT